jgi:thiamine-monophosphate kinase
MTNREDRLIDRIRKKIPSAAGGILRAGIGDDAAVLRAPASSEWLVTVDPFIEDVHFLADAYPPDAVGWKALVRATSDIAAMGAMPQLFLLSLAIPAKRTGRWLDAMLAGMARAAERLGLRLAGGDTAQSSRKNPKVSISVTVFGTVQRGRALLRSGARPGDAIFVTGRLGAAQLGLELILRGLHRERRWKKQLAAQFYPQIFPGLAAWLAEHRLATAMMDISDGLSTDLDRLCRASGVGARIHAATFLSANVPRELARLRLDPLKLALHGGEDYGLLFTVPKRLASRIPRAPGDVPLTRIGKIVPGRGVRLVAVGGSSSLLVARGWDHFSKR